MDMKRVIEGKLVGKGLCFAIVVSRFNGFITKELLSGALDALKRHQVEEEDIRIVWVPGAFELPLIAKRIALKSTGEVDALICLGAVVRGSTPHFEYVASETAKGIASASMETGLPMSFGVLTADSLEQAIERAGTKMGNKGADAALSAIEMANIVLQIEGDQKA